MGDSDLSERLLPMKESHYTVVALSVPFGLYINGYEGNGTCGLFAAPHLQTFPTRNKEVLTEKSIS